MSSDVGDHNPAAEFWQRKYMEERIHSTNVIDSLAVEVFALREELRKTNGVKKLAAFGTAIRDAARDAASKTAAPEQATEAETGMSPDIPEPTGYPTP